MLPEQIQAPGQSGATLSIAPAVAADHSLQLILKAQKDPFRVLLRILQRKFQGIEKIPQMVFHQRKNFIRLFERLHPFLQGTPFPPGFLHGLLRGQEQPLLIGFVVLKPVLQQSAVPVRLPILHIQRRMIHRHIFLPF